MRFNIKHFLVFFLFSSLLFAQVQEVNPPEYIKTITFKGNTPESQLPILRLGEYIILEFDALNGDEEDFYYVIEHFNYDWTPSNLVKAEYLNGFDNQRIINYENSLNTYQIYSHYKLTIPNKRTKGLRVSGNYMIKVYNDYDELVFSRKFMVYENRANVGVAIKRSRDVSNIATKQSVDISITPNGNPFTNPKQTIKTVIVQNNNLNTAISGLEPQYTLGSELIYRYTNKTSFWAGNEYLFFENKDLRVANSGVQFIELKELYHSYLFTNVERFDKAYTYNPDINGNFLVTVIDADDTAIEADYAWVHFSLLMDELPIDKSVYVYGNYNNYAIDNTNKMTYSHERGVYENSLLLKQGFYNYKYVVVDEKGKLDEGLIGGNFWQTENNYKVLVYYRDLGTRYDKLIGVGEGSSVNISN
ncbi:type IX secretion system plug protein [Lacinutrix salivirga]